MGDDGNISGAEWQVMEALWDASAPVSSAEIVDRVSVDNGWTEATVRTLLFRLTKKGFVASDRDGRRFLYRPVIERDAYVGTAADRFIDRMFGGRLAPLVAQFANRDKLSKDEIERLEALIREIKNG